MPRYYTLFACTVFLSSFLLFQVQPLIGKHILPWYGGSSAVWMTALLFFMVALAVGYGYVFWLARLRLPLQVVIHSGMVLLTVGSVWWHTRTWSSGITPSPSDALFALDPTLSVLLTLTVAIGLPFILLSATSSLLQVWYAELCLEEDPSSLYSISNVGSLLGLLSYPFVVEPLLSTAAQGFWWTVGFALYVGLLLSIGWRMYEGEHALRAATGETEKVSLRRFLTWLLVASVPVIALLSGTTFMTTTIAPIPLLWVGPLMLYLISFVWSFRATRTPPHHQLYEGAVFVTACIAIACAWSGVVPVAASVLAVHAVLIALFHWCHEYLYDTRPTPAALPLFYVALSLGGIFGSVVVKISSLWIFVLPIEFTVLLISAIVVILFRWFPVLPPFFPARVRQHFRFIIVGLGALVIGMSATHIMLRQYYVVDQARNFFGYKAIVELPKGGVERRSLQHGLTDHGFQRIVAGEPVIEAVSYYATSSGIGRVFAYLDDAKPEARDVAIIGLGTGGLSAYCRPGDTYTFIEIDPQVITMAQESFTYLDACAGARVIEADGRLALAAQSESEERPQYDVIVLDAYADDMIPVHIMTIDAISQYKKLLAPNGIIAINISSRYLNLAPATVGLAVANDLALRHIYDEKPVSPHAHPSQWVVLSTSPEVFLHPAFSTAATLSPESALYWTDTYSALLPTIKLW